MGGELGAAYQLTSNWKADATLAYAWGKNTTDGKALPQMPPLDTRLGLTYSQDDWSAGALWRLVAPQDRIDRNAGNVVGKDFDKSAGFGVFSLNGAYRINKNLKVSAGVDNLLDKNYSEHLNMAGNAGYGYPANDPTPINEPGRTLWTKVDVELLTTDCSVGAGLPAMNATRVFLENRGDASLASQLPQGSTTNYLAEPLLMSRPTPSFYNLAWRWHFYAGLFVAPFMILLALTGIIYLFKPQLDPLMYDHLLNVTPGHHRLSADEQLQRVRLDYPQGHVSQYLPPVNPERSAQWVVSNDGRELNVFINPYSGEVLGEQDARFNLQAVARALHGELMIGTVGDRLVELAAGWAWCWWFPACTCGGRAGNPPPGFYGHA